MTTINADMTDSQLFVPLSEADALATVPGYYTIGSENLELSGVHMHEGSPPSDGNRPNGRTCIRAVGGSTKASHTSGATLTRYYPDAPSGGGGAASPLAEVLAASPAAYAGVARVIGPFSVTWDTPNLGTGVTLVNLPAGTFVLGVHVEVPIAWDADPDLALLNVNAQGTGLTSVGQFLIGVNWVPINGEGGVNYLIADATGPKAPNLGTINAGTFRFAVAGTLIAQTGSVAGATMGSADVYALVQYPS